MGDKQMGERKLATRAQEIPEPPLGRANQWHSLKTIDLLCLPIVALEAGLAASCWLRMFARCAAAEQRAKCQ